MDKNIKTAAKGENEEVTISKSQLDDILKQLDEQNKKIEQMSKKEALSPTSRDEEKEKELLELVKKENEAAQELVDLYVDKGSLKSNKNIEVNANGVQYVIPKGETVKVPRIVKDIIENSNTQMAIALDLQEEKTAQADKAALEGGI